MLRGGTGAAQNALSLTGQSSPILGLFNSALGLPLALSGGSTPAKVLGGLGSSAGILSGLSSQFPGFASSLPTGTAGALGLVNPLLGIGSSLLNLSQGNSQGAFGLGQGALGLTNQLAGNLTAPGAAAAPMGAEGTLGLGSTTVGELAGAPGLALLPLMLYQLFAQNRNGPLGFLAGAPPSNYQLFPSRVMSGEVKIQQAMQTFADEIRASQTQGDLQQAVSNFRVQVSDAGVGGYANIQEGEAPNFFGPLPDIGPEGVHGVSLPVTHHEEFLGPIRDFLAQNASRYPAGPASAVTRYLSYNEQTALTEQQRIAALRASFLAGGQGPVNYGDWAAAVPEFDPGVGGESPYNDAGVLRGASGGA